MEKKGFLRNQMEQIEEGQKEGLDVSVYAKEEYTAMHMQQIRIGLLEGLPVERYANPDYDWFQMEEIRKGLREGVDIELYASPKISYEKMRQVRKGLTEGVNLAPFLQLDAGILWQIRKAVAARINIVPYIKEGYQAEQLEQIRQALESRLDIGSYITKELRGMAIQEIWKGLEEGLDVSIYSTPEYGWQQMRELRLGLESRLDVRVYAHPFFGWQQMQEIRTGLEEGLDVKRYARLMYTANDMKKIRKEMQQEFVEGLLHGQIQAEYIDDMYVTISENEMEAYVTCGKRPENLKRDTLMKMLKEQGIIYGIDETGIERILAGNVEEGKPVSVAKGTSPVNGKDGWYEYFFRTELNRSPRVMEDGSVNYQDIEWFEVVEEGQKVVFYHEAGQGVCGYTVTGRPLAAHRGKEQGMLRGSGYRLLPDGKTYISAMKGRIELRGNQLLISKLFIFDEITMATGNVDVDGSVYIKGNVGSHTSIKATGDIVVDGYIESAYLECDANIFLRQGMNASGDGTLKAKKGVMGKFFEAVKIQAGEEVRANYCMNCELYTEGKLLISGEKGALIGGKTYAAQGISVFHVGNKSGVPTAVRIGTDEKMDKEKWEIENNISETKKELAVFMDAYADMQRKYAPETRNSMEMYLKVENAIYTKEKELEELLAEETMLGEKWKAAKDAFVTIRGSLFEGVEFEINEMKWTSREVRSVRIKRVNNRIAVYAI